MEPVAAFSLWDVCHTVKVLICADIICPQDVTYPMSSTVTRLF